MVGIAYVLQAGQLDVLAAEQGQPNQLIYTPKATSPTFTHNLQTYKTITILDGASKHVVTTNVSTVNELLTTLNIELSSKDSISYNSIDLFNQDTIRITRISEDIVSLEKPIPYKTSKQTTAKMPTGQKKVKQAGINGLKSLLIKRFFKNGKLVKQTVLEKKTLKPPTKRVILKGTGKVYRTEVVNGTKIRYHAKMRVWATSYDSSCSGCSTTTATGRKLTKGIVAVDPCVIPMHTRMYVPGYGFGQAEDTGGSIKGNKIDLGFENLKNGNWSSRWVTIYLLD